jgi:hypothetical protein
MPAVPSKRKLPGTPGGLVHSDIRLCLDRLRIFLFRPE